MSIKNQIRVGTLGWLPSDARINFHLKNRIWLNKCLTWMLVVMSWGNLWGCSLQDFLKMAGLVLQNGSGSHCHGHPLYIPPLYGYKQSTPGLMNNTRQCPYLLGNTRGWHNTCPCTYSPRDAQGKPCSPATPLVHCSFLMSFLPFFSKHIMTMV
jgi:hypothetical protein